MLTPPGAAEVSPVMFSIWDPALTFVTPLPKESATSIGPWVGLSPMFCTKKRSVISSPALTVSGTVLSNFSFTPVTDAEADATHVAHTNEVTATIRTTLINFLDMLTLPFLASGPTDCVQMTAQSQAAFAPIAHN